LKKILLFLIRCYQCTPTFLHFGCRCIPTCSEYTYEAIERFGASKGVRLGIKRILKCRPGGIFGYQPLEKEVECEKNY